MYAQMLGLASWVTGSRSSAARLTPKLITDLNPAAPVGESAGNKPKTRPIAAAAAAVTRSMRTGIRLLCRNVARRAQRNRSCCARYATVRRPAGQFLALRRRADPPRGPPADVGRPPKSGRYRVHQWRHNPQSKTVAPAGLRAGS